MSSGFQWVVPPTELGKAVKEYGRKVEVALYAVAAYWGQGVQDEARQRATWEDRSGNARSGIFYAVDGLGQGTLVGQISAGARALMGSDVTVESGSGNVLVIVVAHTVFYGKFLELSHGGRYAILLSTIERNLPRLEQLVQEIFKDT